MHGRNVVLQFTIHLLPGSAWDALGCFGVLWDALGKALGPGMYLRSSGEKSLYIHELVSFDGHGNGYVQI